MLDDIWKKNRIPILIASLQWFFTTVLQIDRLFFVYETESAVFLLIKTLYLVVLIGFWIFIFDFYQKVRAEKSEYRRVLKIFNVYLVILLLLLLILWPGTWSWDDAGDLFTEQQYGWTTWQHVLTGIYQEILLQILPFPGGIILLQNVGIALSVAMIITKLETCFNIPCLKNQYIDILVKLLPFYMPPILLYQYSGYRMGVYVYIELAMLVVWLCAMKENEEWNWRYLILFCLLCAVAATWRTESLFYIPGVCCGIFFVKKKVLPNHKKIICILTIMCLFSGINFVQNKGLGNNSYKVISILRPCVELVHAADPEEDTELLKELSRVLNLDIIYENPEVNGEQLYWNYGVVRQSHTQEDYKACLKAFVKLCLKYPQIVIHERMALFVRSAGLKGNSVSTINDTYYFYDREGGNRMAERVRNAGWIANRPIFPQLRKGLLRLLIMQIKDRVFVLKWVVWNIIPPMLVLVYSWCKAVLGKKWNLFLLITTVLIKVPLIILTQPAAWFMYFLSIYLLGYVALIYGLLVCKGVYNTKK